MVAEYWNVWLDYSLVYFLCSCVFHRLNLHWMLAGSSLANPQKLFAQTQTQQTRLKSVAMEGSLPTNQSLLASDEITILLSLFLFLSLSRPVFSNLLSQNKMMGAAIVLQLGAWIFYRLDKEGKMPLLSTEMCYLGFLLLLPAKAHCCCWKYITFTAVLDGLILNTARDVVREMLKTVYGK